MTSVERHRRSAPARPFGRGPAGRLVLLVAAAGLALAGATPAAAAPPTPAAPPATQLAATPVAQSAATADTAVPLPTGDWVRLASAPDGRPAVTVLQRDPHGLAGGYRTERRDGDLYVFPTLAQPYLGRLLDPALFNVSQLARAGYASPTSRLPVRLTYRAGAAHHPVPGLTVTRTQGDNVDGYLTPASARTFGAALAGQVRADAAAHWPTDAGMFAGLTGFRYAGAAAAPPVQPHFPMFTLRITVIGADGQPAPLAGAVVVNADDTRKYASLMFLDGEARISVPVGHYGLLIETVDFTDAGPVERFVNIADYTVSRAQSLSVDMRTATEPVRVSTPRPALLDFSEVVWGRTDANGRTGTVGFAFTPETEVLVDPGAPVRFGQLHFSAAFNLASPASAAEPYTYDVRFDASGAIPRSLTYQVSPADLTTLDARYYADEAGRPHAAQRSALPWMDTFSGTLRPVSGPRTEYLGVAPDVIWWGAYIGFLKIDFSDKENPIFIRAGELGDAFRRYQAGTRLTIDWAKPALRPSLDYDTGLDPDFAYLCPACRKGDSIGISVVPVADTVPGHVGFPDLPGDTPLGPVVSTTRYRLYGNGSLILDRPDVRGATVPVPAADQPYRLVFDETRTAPWITQGIRSQTEWTFSSARPTAPSAPPAWLCAVRDDFTEPPGDCAVLPLLTVNYAAPVDFVGRLPGGANRLGISVAPTQGAPAAAITNASVDVSFDDGLTWTAAGVTAGGAGQFDAVFTAPASGFVSTRVRATDASGNGITQTVIRAYSIGAAA
jgi:hypothetical protein